MILLVVIRRQEEATSDEKTSEAKPLHEKVKDHITSVGSHVANKTKEIYHAAKSKITGSSTEGETEHNEAE